MPGSTQENFAKLSVVQIPTLLPLGAPTGRKGSRKLDPGDMLLTTEYRIYYIEYGQAPGLGTIRASDSRVTILGHNFFLPAM